MKEIQYLKILEQSFLLSWKNKFLWFFGFLVFFGSLVENINFNKNTFFGAGSSPSLFVDFLNQHKDQLFLIASLALAVIIFSYGLKILSSGALILSLNNPVLYKQSKFWQIFKESYEYFWRLFSIDFFLGFAVLTIFFVLSVPVVILFSLHANAFGVLASIVVGLILIPLLVIVFYLKKFGYIFIVLNNANFRSALEFSYNIFHKHLKESLVMGLVAIGLGLCLGVVSAALLILVALIFLPFLLVSYFFLAKTGMLLLLGLGLVVSIATLILVSSFFNVFVQAVWLSFFSQISMQKITERTMEEEEKIESEIPNPEAA